MVQAHERRSFRWSEELGSGRRELNLSSWVSMPLVTIVNGKGRRIDDSLIDRPFRPVLKHPSRKGVLVVQGPAGYSFGNLVKPGWPVTVVVAAVALLIAPLAYRF